MPKPNPYVIDAIEEFLSRKAPKAPKTLAAYFSLLLGSERGTKKAIGIAFARYFHNRRCRSITPREVSEWFAQRSAGAAQPTKHRFSKNAREFLRFLNDRGYVTDDLVAAIEPQPSGEGRIVWLSWDEVHRLLASVKPLRIRLALAWLFYTGCRLSEALSADQSDVQWHEGLQLYVWTIPRSKTHRPRVVWLPQALNPLIDESRRINRPRPSDPILWGCAGRGRADVEDTTRRIARSTLILHLEQAIADAQIHRRVTPHTAKHTYCTLWIEANGDGERSLKKLSDQVGTSVQTLRETYVHLSATPEEFEAIRHFGTKHSPPSAG